jgi:hypothetical protein
MGSLQPDAVWISRMAVWATSLLLGLFLFSHPRFAEAGQVNITVDDMDPSIVYQPAAAWFHNTNTSGCAVCLTPSSPTMAYKSTWHHGLHVVPTLGADDPGNNGRRKRSNGLSTMSLHDMESDLGGERRDNAYDPTNGAKASPFVTDALDSDDPGFVDLPVSVHFNFTGPSRVSSKR